MDQATLDSYNAAVKKIDPTLFVQYAMYPRWLKQVFDGPCLVLYRTEEGYEWHATKLCASRPRINADGTLDWGDPESYAKGITATMAQRDAMLAERPKD